MNFFISLVGMSVQASIVIGVVLLLRLFFSKLNISKKYVMLLWMIPFVCLIIPWKINSPVGFWSSSPAEYKYENMILSRENGTILVLRLFLYICQEKQLLFFRNI